MDRWSQFKESTQEAVKEVIYRKSEISIIIDRRKIILPVNKHDYMNSSLLAITIGELQIKERMKVVGKYEEYYSFDLTSSSLKVKK